MSKGFHGGRGNGGHGHGSGLLDRINDVAHTVSDARELFDDVTQIVGTVSAMADDVSQIIDDVQSIIHGDPSAVVSVASQAAQLAQMLLPAAFETPIISAGLDILSVMSLTLGEGDPDAGGAFNAGAAGLGAAADTLGSAYPDQWYGAASQVYAGQNSRQIHRAGAMSDADNQVARVLAEQARQIAAARRQMDAVSAALGLAIAPAAAAMLDPVGGEAISVAIQVAAVATAMAAAGAVMGTMAAEAAANAAQLRETVPAYRDVASAAEQTQVTLPDPPGATPSRSTPDIAPPLPNTPHGGNRVPAPAGNVSGGGGSSSGGGAAPAAAHASAAPAQPSPNYTMPGAVGGAIGQPAAGSGALPGGSASPAGGGPTAGTGGGGLLAGLASLAAQAAKPKPAEKPGNGEEADLQDPGPEPLPGAETGPDSQSGSAPVHVTVDDGVHHVEFDIAGAEGPVQLSLDPTNMTAPVHVSHISRESDLR